MDFERLDEMTMQVPEHLLPLVQQLLALSEADRRRVIAAVELERELPTLPWDEFNKVKGIASLGGDAVEDCRAVYGKTGARGANA
jgi:hypothetical protein